MKKAGKVLGRVAAGILILVLLAGGAGMFYFKIYLPNTVAPKSFPQIDGEIQVSGLNGQADVYRDSMGIPHIYATTAHDLFFAQGYIHAQDRFWQMDFWRHTGSGRLSEMFGEGQLDTDKFLRTLGWKQTAEAEWEGLNSNTKLMLQAYTDGVNAYLKDHHAEAVSLEYAVLGLLSPNYEIEPWTPVNSLTWGKAMAWDLRGNLEEEVQRSVLLKTLTLEQIAQLFPEYPEEFPVIVNKMPTANRDSIMADIQDSSFDFTHVPVEAVANNLALIDSALGPWSDGLGSNSWVVSGSMTDTGKPFLANDPHLGIQMPSIWYQVGLHCVQKSEDCPFDVAGFSFAGVPGVVIGHNDRIAWGLTNNGPDVMDLFIEKLNPDNPNQYEVNGKWVDFETREEVIKTSKGDSVTITVRSTRHGPVISEVYGPTRNTPSQNPPDDFKPYKDRAGVELPEQYVLALSWTALTPSTPFEAIWGFDQAQNWEEFREAARGFHVPAQNLVYADVDGNIGYQNPGDIPIRAKGDGTLPVPGWTDENEWTGYIPFEELPYAYNPPEGYIVAANNQSSPRDYPYFITKDWNFGFRANRIDELIRNAPGKIDVSYIQKMQGDNYDQLAAVFVPNLLKLDFKSATPNQAVALDALKNWDLQDDADSTPAAIFNAFFRHVMDDTFNDDMPETRYHANVYETRWYGVAWELAKNPNDPYWDDKTTPNITETMDDILIKSFTEGIAELEDMFGKDMSKWNWGDMHAATFKNQSLGKSGVFLIEDLFNRGPFPTGGNKIAVNSTGWSSVDGYPTVWLPSMRMIVDFSDLNNSLTVHTTGESGHAYNEHYADMSGMWAAVQYYPMWWEQDSIIKDAEGHLVLKP